MKTLSVTDLSIGLAYKCGELRFIEREGRFGSYVSLEDRAGVIEVHNTRAEADSRVDEIVVRLAERGI